MHKFKEQIVASIPITLVVFFLFSASGEMLYMAGGNIEGRTEVLGFPFIWVKDGASSLAVDIAIVPLLLDFLIYLFIITTICVYSFKKPYPKKAIIILWVVSIAISAPYFTVYLLDPWVTVFIEYLPHYELVLYDYGFDFGGIIN